MFLYSGVFLSNVEEQTRKDWQRVGLMFTIIASIVFFSIFAFKGGNYSTGGTTITGAVIGGGDALTQAWIFPFLAAIIFLGATFAYAKINQ